MAEARYDEIGVKLSDPTVIADNKLYRDLMREHKSLTPLMEVWHKYKKAQRSFDDAVEALNEAGIPAVVFGKAFYEGRITLLDLKAFLP